MSISPLSANAFFFDPMDPVDPQPDNYYAPPFLLDSAEFRSWSATYQAAYVNDNGAGVPKAVVIGSVGGGSILATASGGAPTITAEPAGSGADFGNLDVAAFKTWDGPFQEAYLFQRNMYQSLNTVLGRIGEGAVLALAGTSPLQFADEPISAAKTPDKLPAATFQGWSHEEFQAAYVDRYGNGDPKTLFLGTLGQGSLNAVFDYPNGVTVASEPTGFADPPSAVTKADFETWPSFYQAKCGIL